MALSARSRVLRRAAGAAPVEVGGDLCIVGSGIAGISTALESSRLGARAVLVEGAPTLGGQAVGAEIGTFCGLFGNGADPPQLTHGIADEILRDLGATGDLHYIRGRRNTVIVLYRIEALARWIEERVRESGIAVVLGAVLREVERDGRRIEALHCSTRYGDVLVRTQSFVDASGDAALAWLAGLPVREVEGVSIQGTVMVRFEGVDEAALVGLDRAELQRRLEVKGDSYGLRRRDGFVFAFPGTGEAIANMTHLETPLDPVAASRAMLEGRAQADRLVAFLKAEYPAAFARARVRSYGQPGIRQTHSIVGGYQLTAEDVRSGRDFSDAILRCSWPIEFHDRPEGVLWEEFGEGHLHRLPFRSLAPPDVDNLLAVGRCIDADPVALSSVRVMGPCIAMGAAAAHGLDLAGSGSVHQIDPAALRRRLAHNLGLED
jgi:hypothetical protein